MPLFGKNGKVSEWFHGYEANQGDKCIACAICGFVYPKKVCKKHYKLEQLVCPDCFDLNEKITDKGDVVC